MLFTLDGESRKAEYKITENGRVNVPSAIMHNASDLRPSVTFLYPPEYTGNRFCGGVQVQFDDLDTVTATCEPSGSGVALICEVVVPSRQAAMGPPWRLSFTMVPQKPLWLDLKGLDANHAIKKTYNGYYEQLQLPSRVRVRAVKGPATESVNGLTIVIEGP